jgi:hypothetical protein
MDESMSAVAFAPVDKAIKPRATHAADRYFMKQLPKIGISKASSLEKLVRALARHTASPNSLEQESSGSSAAEMAAESTLNGFYSLWCPVPIVRSAHTDFAHKLLLPTLSEQEVCSRNCWWRPILKLGRINGEIAFFLHRWKPGSRLGVP